MVGERQYFGTDGIRGRVGSSVINAEFALRLGYAAGRVLTREHRESARPIVLIGKDTRISGYMLESALEAGLSAAGIDVLLAGPMPTPAVAYLTRALRLSAGIVISASHNPYFDNGIKFFSSDGMKLPDEVELRIEQALAEPVGCVFSEKLGRAKRLNDAAGRYIEFCKSGFPADLDLVGLKLVVDAAHGAAYHIAPSVFEELGATVSRIGCAPDGLNINDGVGATAPDALVKAVVTAQADLGIALDGDADRLLMVDGTGRLYNGDELLYVIVADRLRRGPVAGVVGTLMTNLAFEHRMRELNVPFERAAVGDRYVLAMLQQKGWLYGGEGSGHLICLDRHTTGDGIVAALQVLAAMQRQRKPLSELLDGLRLYPQKLVNVPLAPGLDWRTHEGLNQAREEVERQLDGKGRVLIRASGTEPKLRLMVEAADAALVDGCLETLSASLR
ncbi:MAG: phosphoglucosamine mutase [Pigmentiphaga sp.]|uniref:phosphoglucosamine mutase n=1 Tax=Pigmentiphaga sp. TaxID=1977564 RepID=UPI0029B7EFD9|nr:phosphoglucosamine mutase [Pigmentiphaga sp.]MDX3904314.1 phosphoglucosamine mutase [Pigmentiphaga sp.]